MKPYPESWLDGMIAHSVSQFNVLPLTSRCNIRCRFCSHQGNPPEFRLPFLSDRPLEKVESDLEFLDRDLKIVIGESATRIPEGEPLLYPDLVPLLTRVRERFPGTLVQLTTNGIELTKEMASFLAGVSPLEVVVSLNSSTPRGRMLLMGDRQPRRAIAGVELLARLGIPFHGSLVLMPELVGWEDIEQTIAFLDGQGCQTIRLLMPGYTDWGKSRGQSVGISLSDWASIGSRIEQLRTRCETPITTEPALWDLGDQGAPLSARVEGVIKGSPAAAAGLRSGDEITAVDGIKVFSRVDAFERVRQSGRSRLRIARRDGSQPNTLEIQVAKSPGQSSGLVMNYDIDPRLVRRIEDRAAGGGTLVLTSRLAFPVMKAAGMDGVFIQAAANRTLGGNIGCAGLLTVSDLVEGFREFRDLSPGVDLQRVLVPEIAFDHRGEDLTGRGFWEIESLTGVKVVSI